MQVGNPLPAFAFIMKREMKDHRVKRFMERTSDMETITARDKLKMDEGVRAAKLYYLESKTLNETASEMGVSVDTVQFLIEIGWRIIQTEQNDDIESQRRGEISKIDLLREQHYRMALRTEKKVVGEDGEEKTVYDENSVKAASVVMKATEIRMKLTGMDEVPKEKEDEGSIKAAIRGMDIRSLMSLSELLAKKAD